MGGRERLFGVPGIERVGRREVHLLADQPASRPDKMYGMYGMYLRR